MSNVSRITVAHGDGIGPEIMNACLHIIKEAGAGIGLSAWESLRRTKVFYKAPITTPQGGGFKSLNVTARKMLGLYPATMQKAAGDGLDLLMLDNRGVEIAKTETLRNFDGKPGYTLAQGQ